MIILILAGLGALPGLQQVDPLLADEGNYYTLASYSFLVGFSEPFTLNFVERFVTGAIV